MNGWDFFTYLMCAVLAVSAIWVFVLFLRDAGGIIRGSDSEDEVHEVAHEVPAGGYALSTTGTRWRRMCLRFIQRRRWAHLDNLFNSYARAPRPPPRGR